MRDGSFSRQFDLTAIRVPEFFGRGLGKKPELGRPAGSQGLSLGQRLLVEKKTKGIWKW
jgi:hypothetical protein